MNRLQKKYVIGTAGFHLLLLIILIVGPAFFLPRPKSDDNTVLDVIPANLVDDAVNRGVKNATPPAPAVVPPPVTPTPVSKPVVQPTPAPTPVPTLMQKVAKFFTPAPVNPASAPEPAETQPHTPKVNLQVVTRNVPKTTATPEHPTPDNSKAINAALKALRKNLSSPTEVAPVGNDSAAAANYALVVKSVYEQAWAPPDNTASDDANVKVRVTIARDGSVISARVIEPAGDDSVDASVQRTLDRVQFIAPFPSGSADTERTYIINFNLKAKRLLEEN